MTASQQSDVQPNVYVVDDDELVLHSITDMVREAGWSTSAHSEVESFLSELRPDEHACVLLDLRMPGVEGMSLLRELNSRFPDIPVVMMSGCADIASAMEALRCGALDFVVKPFHRDELLDKIQKAATVATRDRLDRNRVRDVQRRMERLTPREREVLGLLRLGKSVKQVGYELGVSHKTVQVHRARILDAMHVESMVELVNLLHDIESLTHRQGSIVPATDHGHPRDVAGNSARSGATLPDRTQDSRFP